MLRLDAQSEAFFSIMHNNPIHSSPDPNTVSKILDIGCGSGGMTLYLAQKYPQATIYGVDLMHNVSPQGRALADKLGNIRWVQGNFFDLVGTHPEVEDASFDLTYSRLVVAGLKSWTAYIGAIKRLLKPGGWCEIHELSDIAFYDAENRIISADWEWVNVINSNSMSRGLERNNGVPSLPYTLQTQGFEEAGGKLYKLPQGVPVPGKPETEKWAKYAPDGVVQVFSDGVWYILKDQPKEEYERVQRNVRETLQPREGVWMPFYVVWARKPLRA
jgi:SAM-dependent methyltransferase